MASGVASNSFKRAHGVNPAAVINHDPVANVFHVRAQMAAQNDCFAAASQCDNQVFHFATADRIEAGSRLIQNDQIGIIDKGLREADAALHAFGEFADGAGASLLKPTISSNCSPRFAREPLSK